MSKRSKEHVIKLTKNKIAKDLCEVKQLIGTLRKRVKKDNNKRVKEEKSKKAN